MTLPEIERLKERPMEHDEVSKLLPWYVSGQLGECEQGKVAQHLETCDRCRQEHDDCVGLRATIKRDHAENSWQPPAGHFDQLLAMIDVAELPGARAVPSANSDRFSWISRWCRWVERPFSEISARPWIWAAEAAAMACLGIVLLLPRQDGPSPADAAYETLTSAGQPVDMTTRLRLSVTISGSTGDPDIRQLLRSTGATIVAGPSALGVYTIDLAPAPSVDARDAVLEAYRRHPKISVLGEVPATVEGTSR